MSTPRLVAAAAAVLVLIGTSPVRSQGGGQPPPMPKPGPEHEVFKMDVGTWDATVEFTPGPGSPQTSKGVEVNTIGCGGLCLITDFKGDMMPGVPFHGHGLATWDPAKKKYVASWTDSISTGLAVGEGTWDPAAKRTSGWMEGPDMTGKITKTRTVGEYTAAGRVYTAYAPGPDGKEMQVMRITYTKRK